MKKYKLIVLLTLFGGFVSGQNLLENNKTWSVVECCGGCFTTLYKIDGDTLIGGNTYKQFWISLDSTFTYCSYYKTLREETDGKVYQLGDSGEELLYDFGLEVNEIFSTSLNGCSIELQVVSIDSVTLLNGEKRKRINLNWDGESWIEGIGSTMGLTNVGAYQCYFDIYFYLNCVTENEMLVYKNPDFDGCYVICVGFPEIESKTFSFQCAPNPFTDFTKFVFSYSPVKSYSLQIVNITGREVLSFPEIHTAEVIIPGQAMKSGLYFIQFFENGKLNQTRKIIKY